MLVIVGWDWNIFHVLGHLGPFLDARQVGHILVRWSLDRDDVSDFELMI